MSFPYQCTDRIVFCRWIESLFRACTSITLGLCLYENEEKSWTMSSAQENVRDWESPIFSNTFSSSAALLFWKTYLTSQMDLVASDLFTHLFKNCGRHWSRNCSCSQILWQQIFLSKSAPFLPLVVLNDIHSTWKNYELPFCFQLFPYFSP